MRAVALFVCLVLLAASAQLAWAEASGPGVESFAPAGTVKNVRQAAARFAEAMVRFGASRQEAPFAVNCPVPGRGRWLDARQWVFDFERDLPAGLRCEFTLKPGLKTLAGAPLAGPDRFMFDTGGPAIMASLPDDGAVDVDEDPLFILKLDAAAQPESVAAHARCEVEGLGERIEAALLPGEERARLLAGPVRRDNRYFFENTPEERLAVLRCRRRFAPEASVRLVWGAGIASAAGVASQQDQVLNFKIRPAFTVHFECDKVNAQARCIPFLPMRLAFSAPVPAELAALIKLSDAQGKVYPAENLDPAKQPSAESLQFKGPFPENTRFTIALPPGFKDDAGRALDNAGQFPLAVETDDYPPLAKFNGEFGILEAKEGGVLPVTLRNLEPSVQTQAARPVQAAIPGQMQKLGQDDFAMAQWLRKIQQAAATRFEELPKAHEEDETHYRNLTGAESVFGPAEKHQAFELPTPEGAKAFEVVGIPLGKPGFYVVELASPRLGAALLGEPRPRYVATAALVTNLSVHFKWGRESSLVWVTSLDQAQPVANAELKISDFCTGVEFWRGRTGADGTARIEGSNVLPDAAADACYEGSRDHPLMVSARVGDDLGLVVSNWNKGLHPYEFKLDTGSEAETKLAHAVFDRSLLRAGETLSMKLLLRHRVPQGFAAYAGEIPDTVEIRHNGSGEKYTLPVKFDPGGIALAAWAIPKEAKLGVYNVALRKGENWIAEVGAFRVEQFRVPTMKAALQPAADYLVNAQEASVDVFVGYLAGGGASSLPVKLRSQVRPRAVQFADYADFQFGGGEIKEGLAAETEPADEAEAVSPAQVLPLALDKGGAARAKIPNLPKADVPRELLAELEYQDANGQLLSVARRIPLWPARLALGIKPENWAASPERLRFHVVALDPAGQPQQGRKVRVELFKKTTYSYRKRLIGGFYDYENQSEYRKLEPVCEEKSDAQGLVACDMKPGVSGSVVLRAAAADGEGNQAVSSQEIWVAGGGDWWFDHGPSDRMDVLPEKKSWEAGQAARLQVRMPFREATALVTVEREGVLDAFVVPLSGKDPLVEVPIKPHYAPNVYVSVLAVRGRAQDRFAWFRELAAKFGFKLEDKSVTALVDLNKPAYRLGIAPINVGWTPNRLDVSVQPERQDYKVREVAKVKVKVARADGGPLPASSEIALAAVDEGLLELRPNDSWKLLDRMMGQRGIEVYTATAQMQVVGKRHYGRKALPTGGGGGRQTTRELFDTLLLWRGRVALDPLGEAEIEVPLNDSLTAFRVAAVAHAGMGYFGTGEATLRTTQPVMLHSGLLPLVRENDAYKAVFTLRNASDRGLALTAKARWSVAGRVAAKPGLPCSQTIGKTAELLLETGEAPAPPKDAPCPDDAGWKVLPPIALELKPGEAKELAWDAVAPLDADKLDWEVSAATADGSAADRLKLTQEVVPAWPVRIDQATLAQLGDPMELNVERPADTVPGRGGVRVSARARLGDGLGGVQEFMGRYPYVCLEQRVSKAVALRDPKLWAQAMDGLPAFIDRDGLLKYFATDALRGSDVLSAYVLAIAHEAGWTIPAEPLKRIQDGLKDFVGGRVQRGSTLAAADLGLRKLAAIEALSRYGLAKPEMLGSISLEPTLWPTSALLDWLGILKRVPAIPQRDALLQQAFQILRARLNWQGTTLGFSTEDSDRLGWLMVSVDENAVRALLGLLDQPPWRADIPRLATGALGRQSHGHWDTTAANAWGTLAMEKFSAAFEAAPVGGYTLAELDGVKQGVEWRDGSQPPALDFPWSPGPASLFIKHTGSGKPWVLIQSRTASQRRQPDFAGYSIKRSIEPVEQKQAGVWSKGDVARIKLALDAQADMAWVVVDDPVPAGATILGSGLGGDSALLAAGEQREGRAWPAFEERRLEAFRAYYEYVPKGQWTLEYTLRLNDPGRFELPATRVEAMYAPDMHGELPNKVWEIH